MRRALLVLCAVVVSVSFLHAAPNVAVTPIASNASLEIVVLEARGCVYCGHFRKVIGSVYETSKHARYIPLAYMQVDDEGAVALELAKPIQIVPTVVVIDGREEIGRIPGYVGKREFFHLIDQILAAH